MNLKLFLAETKVICIFAAKNNAKKMKIIGRKEEIRELDRLARSGCPEFVAIYGRRRVGKTFLVKEYFNNCFVFYATGVSR